MPLRFLNNQWRFCHVWHKPENPFEFERERERLLNLSARSNFKWTNQSWRWIDLASGRCRGPHYKSLRKAEEANFKANFSFFYESFDRRSTSIWSEIYWTLWNCWFFCDSGPSFLRRKRFVKWRLAGDGWSGLEVSHDEAKMKDLP